MGKRFGETGIYLDSRFSHLRERQLMKDAVLSNAKDEIEDLEAGNAKIVKLCLSLLKGAKHEQKKMAQEMVDLFREYEINMDGLNIHFVEALERLTGKKLIPTPWRHIAIHYEIRNI